MFSQELSKVQYADGPVKRGLATCGRFGALQSGYRPPLINLIHALIFTPTQKNHI